MIKNVKFVKQMKFYLMENVQEVAKMVITTMSENVINVLTNIKVVKMSKIAFHVKSPNTYSKKIVK